MIHSGSVLPHYDGSMRARTHWLCGLLAAHVVLPGFAAFASTGQNPQWTHVNPSADSDGDGTAQAPFRSLQRALEAGAQAIQLSAGTFTGPFGDLQRPVHLRGAGPAETFLSTQTPDAPMLRVRDAVTLEGLCFRHGKIGVEVVGPRARLQARRVSWDGSFKPALWLRQAQANLQDTVFQGSQVGIRSEASALVAEGATFHGKAGPAILCQSGTCELRRVVVVGHEYGLMASNESRVTLREFASNLSERAGIALVSSQLDAQDIEILEPGHLAGIQLIGSRASIRRFWIHKAQAYALSARNGELTLSEGTITDVRVQADEGDGLHLRAERATLNGVFVRNVPRAGLFAAESAHVVATDFVVEQAGGTGLFADAKSEVLVRTMTFVGRSVPALVATDRSSIRVGWLEQAGSPKPWIQADCAGGAKISVAHARGFPGPLSGCESAR
jgi:hypothetical protein